MEPQFEVLPPDRRVPQPPRKKPGGIIGGLIAFGYLILKFGSASLIFLKTGLTMLISIGAYSLIFGWKFAAGLVVLILVHEMGHFGAAKIYRVQVTAPMFIPFFGAYVMLKNRPMDPWINAMISYAGPLAGGLGGWACYYVGVASGLHWVMAVALYTFILNLVNLAPIPPLDGSHIWICFSRNRTPGMSFSDRVYTGIFLAALIAGLILGCLETWGNLPPPASL